MGSRCATTAHAITYASTLPEIDPTRIGIWGSSYSAATCWSSARSTAA